MPKGRNPAEARENGKSTSRECAEQRGGREKTEHRGVANARNSAESRKDKTSRTSREDGTPRSPERTKHQSPGWSAAEPWGAAPKSPPALKGRDKHEGGIPAPRTPSPQSTGVLPGEPAPRWAICTPAPGKGVHNARIRRVSRMKGPGIVDCKQLNGNGLRIALGDWHRPCISKNHAGSDRPFNETTFANPQTSDSYETRNHRH